MSRADLAEIVDFTLDTIETYQNGQCVGSPPMHVTKCTNVTAQDSFCDCLTDAAGHCAKAHDKNWWKFTACMFEHNGKGSAAGTGLSDDSTFEATMRSCAQKLATYSFEDLKTCYTGAEGSGYIYDSAQTSQTAGAAHPTWIYVGTDLVDGNTFESIDDWGAEVVKTICSAYNGTKPASCSTRVMV